MLLVCFFLIITLLQYLFFVFDKNISNISSFLNVNNFKFKVFIDYSSVVSSELNF